MPAAGPGRIARRAVTVLAGCAFPAEWCVSSYAGPYWLCSRGSVSFDTLDGARQTVFYAMERYVAWELPGSRPPGGFVFGCYLTAAEPGSRGFTVGKKTWYDTGPYVTRLPFPARRISNDPTTLGRVVSDSEF
jgi:hypothetical protein